MKETEKPQETEEERTTPTPHKKCLTFFRFDIETHSPLYLDCKQSLSGQSRWCAHSAAPFRSFALVLFSPSALSRDLSTIQKLPEKGTACSLLYITMF